MVMRRNALSLSEVDPLRYGQTETDRDVSGVQKNVPLSHRNAPIVHERTLYLDTAQQDSFFMGHSNFFRTPDKL